MRNQLEMTQSTIADVISSLNGSGVVVHLDGFLEKTIYFCYLRRLYLFLTLARLILLWSVYLWGAASPYIIARLFCKDQRNVLF